MKKTISTFAIVLCTYMVQGQIGINTVNPQGAFHIDGKKNNPEAGIPNNSLTKDDFIVTSDGRVGIGIALPDASAALHLADMNKGFLPSRVMLQSTDDTTTITSPAIGLLVYNFMTTGTYPKNVFPGYYYWSGQQWVRFNTSSSSGTSDALYLIADTTKASQYIIGSAIEKAGNAIRILKEFHNPGGYNFNKDSGVLVVAESGLYHFQFQLSWFDTGSGYNRNVAIGVKQDYATNPYWKGRVNMTVNPANGTGISDMPNAKSGYFTAHLTAGMPYVLTVATYGAINISNDNSLPNDVQVGTNENKGWGSSFIIKKIF